MKVYLRDDSMGHSLLNVVSDDEKMKMTRDMTSSYIHKTYITVFSMQCHINGRDFELQTLFF